MKAFSALLACPLVFLAAGCGETSMVVPGGTAIARPAPDDDDLFAMVPAEADLVLWADLAKLRASPWTRDGFAKVTATQPDAGEPAYGEIRDLDRLVFAKVPSFRDGASVLVAQGRLDRERIRKAFARTGGAVETRRTEGPTCWFVETRRWHFLARGQ